MDDRGAWWSELQLLEEQLDAIGSWFAERTAACTKGQLGRLPREHRLDLRRRVDVLARQQQALHRSVARDHDWTSTGRPRAVLAHAHDWTRHHLAQELQRCGVTVLLASANGADAVGASVADQPDLVLVGARVQMMATEDVVRDVRRFARRAAVLVEVADDRQRARVLDAGATTTLPCPFPTASADELARALRSVLAHQRPLRRVTA